MSAHSDQGEPGTRILRSDRRRDVRLSWNERRAFRRLARREDGLSELDFALQVLATMSFMSPITPPMHLTKPSAEAVRPSDPFTD